MTLWFESALLSEGRPADIVSLDLAHPSLAERQGNALIDGWIFAAGNRGVDCVWRGGRKLVSGGRHLAAGSIGGAYRQALRGLVG